LFNVLGWKNLSVFPETIMRLSSSDRNHPEP
jgi:hypothetical protein